MNAPSLSDRFAAHLDRRARFRSTYLVLALLPVLLIAHSFDDGLYGDDFIHRTWLHDSPEANALAQSLLPENPPEENRLAFALTELYTFASPERNSHWMQLGILPWWTHSDLRVRFMRPLSAFAHWFDYRVWPEAPIAMHVHNGLWLFALAFAAMMVFRAMLPPIPAMIASAAFALNECLGAAAWIAGRNALMAASFGFAALYAHHSRKTGLACLLFGLSLLSAESGLSTLAYLFAYALCVDTRMLRQRMASLLPYAGLALFWRVVYSMFGYGVTNSGVYHDPIRYPFDYGSSLLQYAPLLAVKAFLPDGLLHWPLLSAVIALIGFTIVIYLAWSRPLARFFAAGAALSLLPACIHDWCLDIDRLLYFPMLGVSGLLGLIVVEAFACARRSERFLPKAACHVAASALLVSIGIANPAGMAISASEPAHEQADLERWTYAPFGHDDTAALWLIDAPNSTAHYYYPYWSRNGAKPPRHILYTRGLQADVDELGHESQMLRFHEGMMLDRFDSVWRREPGGFRAGQTIALGEANVEIIDVNLSGVPLMVKIDYASPDASGACEWAIWFGDRYSKISF